jgi:hypothetical protein
MRRRTPGDRQAEPAVLRCALPQAGFSGAERHAAPKRERAVVVPISVNDGPVTIVLEA